MILDAIKLTPQTADQLVEVVLGGNPYTLRVLWNDRAGYFSLSLFERDGGLILENIKMVKGYPLLARFQDVRLPIGDLIFIDPKNRETRPDFGSLDDYILAYYEPDEVPVIAPIVEGTAESIWDGGATLWSDDGERSVWDAV